MAGYECDLTTNTCVQSSSDAAVDGDVNLPDAGPSVIPVRLALGGSHTCVLFDDQTIKCWGKSEFGQTGYATTTPIGDDENPSARGTVDVGEPVEEVSAGDDHTCVLLESGTVRCFGENMSYQLGYPDSEHDVGDDEVPGDVPAVDIGGTVAQVAAGNYHTCVVMEDKTIKCWAQGTFGKLGYGNTSTVVVPSSVGAIAVGANVLQLAPGFAHTCALLEGNDVRCWGRGNEGQLGYNSTDNIGDTQAPNTVGIVDVGGEVTQVVAGVYHTCVRFTDGTVRCWGAGADGALGYGNYDTIGDTELPSSVGPVSVGGSVVKLTAGAYHTCALLSDQTVRCWGRNADGQLGYGITDNIGDTEVPSSKGAVSVGGKVLDIDAGDFHTCVILEGAAVRCWGRNTSGQLGYGHTETIGDTELPHTQGPVELR